MNLPNYSKSKRKSLNREAANTAINCNISDALVFAKK